METIYSRSMKKRRTSPGQYLRRTKAAGWTSLETVFDSSSSKSLISMEISFQWWHFIGEKRKETSFKDKCCKSDGAQRSTLPKYTAETETLLENQVSIVRNITSCAICTRFYESRNPKILGGRKMHPLSLFCSFRNHFSLLIIRIRRIE